MLFKNITIVDENYEIKENMYVGIVEDRITYISSEMPKDNFGRIYEGKGKLLMCGFVNAHGHSPMTLMRGYGENLALQDWLNKRIFPFEDKLDGNAVYWATLLAMAESIRFGIVSSSDMYYFPDEMASAILDSGAKNNMSRSITNFTDAGLWDLDSAKEMKHAYETYHNKGHGRLKVDMSLHAEYTSNPKTAKALAEYTKEIGAIMHVHVSETKSEHEACKERHNGLTPVAYLNKQGILDTPTIAAHCVWIEGEDYETLKEKGVTVASCPVSNMKLASGICNVPELTKQGINVAIGTDSVASNNSLNYIEELKFFATGSKVQLKDPTAITPKETLYAATCGGMKAQGREDCGFMKEGYKADLIVIDISGPHMYPMHNLLNNLIYSASGSDIVMTMVDGNVLYENGEFYTIDVEKTIYETDKAVNKILNLLAR